MGLVIFDLDGTLTPQRPSSTSAFASELCGGVRDRCRELLAAGHTLALASNQGGTGKGLSVMAVEAQLGWVCAELGMAAARFAWEPARKKPGPAMLLELMDQFRAAAAETWMVGDSEADERAAAAAGVRFVHVTSFVAGGLV
jgi:D-glycero-D-manno-heptose 1,7-bisphosphate phosphatase